MNGNLLIGKDFDVKYVKGNSSKWKDYLAFLEDIGFECLEIQPYRLGVMTVDGKLIKERMEKLKEMLSFHKFKYTVHAPILSDPINKDEESIKRVCKNSLNFSEYFNSNLIGLHTGVLLQLKEPKSFFSWYWEKQEKKKDFL